MSNFMISFSLLIFYLYKLIGSRQKEKTVREAYANEAYRYLIKDKQQCT